MNVVNTHFVTYSETTQSYIFPLFSVIVTGCYKRVTLIYKYCGKKGIICRMITLTGKTVTGLFNLRISWKCVLKWLSLFNSVSS